MWTAWVPFQNCSTTCGNDLIKQRRYCTNPLSPENGHDCWGPNNSSHQCDVNVICPG